MDLKRTLTHFGLTPSETEIYLFLLSHGLSTPTLVSRETTIARTNCYHVFKSLLTKGLIEEQILHKRKAYLAKEPEALITLLESKKQSAERLLPELRNLHVTQRNKPRIHCEEDTIKIATELQKALTSREVYIFGTLDRLTEAFPAFIKEITGKKAQKLPKLHIFDVKKTKAVSRETKKVLNKLFKHQVLLSDALPPTTILSWDTTVLLLTLEDPQISTTITNPFVATTFQILFESLQKK